MSNEDVQILGLKELQLKLATLPERISRAGLRSGCAAASAVIRDEARLKAPVYDAVIKGDHPPVGTLKRSIISKRINEKCNMYHQVYKVTVRKGIKLTKSGKRNRKTDAYYASWVEYGHYFVPRGPSLKKTRTASQSLLEKRKVKTSSEGSYYIMPHPFMRPAWESKKGEAQRVFTEALRKKIEEIVK